MSSNRSSLGTTSNPSLVNKSTLARNFAPQRGPVGHKTARRQTRKMLHPIITSHGNNAIRFIYKEDEIQVHWHVDFKLPSPAQRQGYIYQRVNIKYRSARDNEDELYYEAWPVRAGKTSVDKKPLQKYLDSFKQQDYEKVPKYEDTFGVWLKKGEEGTFQEWGRALFYEGRRPADFIRHGAKSAHELLSSEKRPAFWAHRGLKRYLRCTFDLTSDDRKKWNVNVETRIYKTDTKYTRRTDSFDGVE